MFCSAGVVHLLFMLSIKLKPFFVTCQSYKFFLVNKDILDSEFPSFYYVGRSRFSKL